MMNRRLTRLILFIFCCSVLTACGGVTKDERVYGTWTEISTGETVEFRRDGTLAWFGMEGTFEFRRSTNWASCIGMSGCPTGQVGIDVGGEGFRASFYSSRFDEDPDSWYLSFRSFSAMPYEATLDGRTTGGIQLFREGTITSPMVLPGFEKAEAGLSARFPTASKMRKYNGELVAVVESSLHRFNRQSQTWVDTGVESYGMNFGESVIHTGDQFSLDVGQTWNEIPFLSGASPEGEIAAHGTILYQTRRIDEDGQPVSRQTWRLDLLAPNLAWEMVSQESTDDYFTRQIVSVGPSAPLIRWVHFYEENSVVIQKSYDDGLSWDSMNSDCWHEPRIHTDGIYCAADDETIRWYSISSNTWTTVNLNLSDTLYPSSFPYDVLYVYRDEQVIQVDPFTGAEEVMATYADVRRRPGMFVFDDEIWLSCFTLWRKDR